MVDKITKSRNGIKVANEGMDSMKYSVLNQIRAELSYLTGNRYERGQLVGLSPNEIIEKAIGDLNALKGSDEFVETNGKYMDLRMEKTKLEANVAQTKSEIEKALGEDRKDAFSIPLKGLLKYSLAYGIAEDIRWGQNRMVAAEDILLGDLVKFCLENEDREYAVKHFKNVGDGEVRKIKELFDRYGIEI